jgi:hypothetical protein
LRDIKFNSLDEVFVKAMAYELSIKEQNEEIGYANSSYLVSYSQPLYASQITNGVEVAPTFSSSLANVNNHDLVHHNYGQINENSESMYLDEEIRKEDLPEEMHQELDQILAQCDFLYQVAISKNNKNNSDLSNSSVIMATKPNSVHSESVTTKESSLAVEEHINQKETAMLDFSEAGVVVHLTSDYHATKRQVQADKSSKHQTVENQDKGGKKRLLACRHKVIFSNLGGTSLTGSLHRSDRSKRSMTVACHQEEKYDIIHIKVPHLSNAFDKVCFASNSQSDPIVSFNSFISDSIMNNSKRSIEDDLLVSDSMPLDSISQCTVKIKKVDHKNTLTFKFSKLSLSKFFSSWCTYGYSGFKSKKSKSRAIVKSDAHIVTNFKASGMRSAKKGMAEWVDEKSESFVYLALKPSPQKHGLEKIKYTFDLTLCDNLFDILLENNFIKLFDHKVSPSPPELGHQNIASGIIHLIIILVIAIFLSIHTIGH